MDPKNVLFVQRSAHKAGAQHCLARVLRQLEERGLDPVLLTAENEWLTQECLKHQIRVIQIPFPSSRSLLSYLYKNSSFARRVQAELRKIRCRPPIVHGNDHPESLLTLELTRVLQAKSGITLRTPGMTREDYSNYGCGRADLLIAVSDLLRNSVREWHHDREVVVIPDGLADEEFLPPKSPLKSPPERILVLGDASARKGWKDLVAALEILLKEGKLPTVNFDFTDIRPPWLKTSNFGNRCTLNFIGHRDDFRDLVRQYELVINPSRSESFGMAALEVIAAGIPLLSSRSGVIEDIIEDPRFLFEPHNPMSLAAVLHDLLVHGSSTGYDLESNQHKLRNRFPIKGNVERLLDQYKKLFT